MPPSASRHLVGRVVQQVPWYGPIPVADGVSEVELASLKPKEVENDRKSLFSVFFGTRRPSSSTVIFRLLLQIV